MSRRDFLTRGALTFGMAIAPQIWLPRRARGMTRNARVIRTYHPLATTGWTQVNQGPVDQMVHTAISALTGIPDIGAAWKSLFPGITPAKKICLKINLACGDVPTHPQIVNAIVDGLLLMNLDGQQLPEDHIIVWDLDNAFFCAQTGYAVNYGGPGVQYFGTDHAGVGFDSSMACTIQHPGTTSTHNPSRIITQLSDYMINVGVIKDHSEAGVTLCLKNNYGSFNNVAIYPLHVSGTYGDGHTRGEPSLNAWLRDALGNRQRLFIIDATYGLYNGGPGYTPPGHTPPNWAYNSLIMGFDPVAVDRIGTVKMNVERAAHGLGPRNPSHVTAAAGAPYNLGTGDPAEIDLVEIDAQQQSGVGDRPEVAGGLVLYPPVPNPVRESCVIRWRAGRNHPVELSMFDARGALVRRWENVSGSGALRRVQWDGRDHGGRAVASGVYFLRMRTPEGVAEQRITVVR